MSNWLWNTPSPRPSPGGRGGERRRGDGDFAGGFAGDFQGDVDAIFGEDVCYARRPFDYDNAVLVEKLGEADVDEVFAAVDAVGVEVKDGKARGLINVEKDEGGAGDSAGIAAEGTDQAADELGFAGAELTFEGDDVAGGEGGGEAGGDGFGVGDAAGGVGHARGL